MPAMRYVLDDVTGALLDVDEAKRWDPESRSWVDGPDMAGIYLEGERITDERAAAIVRETSPEAADAMIAASRAANSSDSSGSD